MLLRVSIAMLVVILTCGGCDVRTHAKPASASPFVAPPVVSSAAFASIETHGTAPSPTLPPRLLLGRPEAEDYKSLALRAGACRYAQAATSINRKLYIGCSEGMIVLLDAHHNVLKSAKVPMYGINAITPAGEGAIAVSGFNAGATIRNELSILHARSLKPVVLHSMSDSTFLGDLDDRAYIDDWCCNGRADEYQPATIYSISLKDGSESPPVNLAPDPQSHPGNLQPLGQGGRNYMIGQYLYVVVGPVTYRYELRDLRKAPARMATANPAP